MTVSNKKRSQSLTDNIPLDMASKGYGLVFEKPRLEPDPVYLRDRDKHDLFVWEYIPSLTEVRDKCRELGL